MASKYVTEVINITLEPSETATYTLKYAPSEVDTEMTIWYNNSATSVVIRDWRQPLDGEHLSWDGNRTFTLKNQSSSTRTWIDVDYMAEIPTYGFNADKSKQKIADIKTLEHTFTNVSPYTSSGYSFTKSTLTNLGIDVSKYMVIGVSQQIDGKVRFNSHFVPKSTLDSSEHHYFTRPCATMSDVSYDNLILTVYNNTNETADIIGKVMLMEIK